MKIITSSSDIQHELANFRHEQIALVATMGCLHEGHLSLIRQAKRLADVVVVSIYVNPLQFSASEDLGSYPKPFAHDAKLCADEGVDFIFHPDDLYPASGIQIGLHVGEISTVLCGASRQRHFDGVVTVVNILFNLIQPNIAIFGEKDFQQLTIIRRMVSDLHMQLEIIEGATVRETDGLAKSSRNRYLNDQQRQQAPHLFQAMQYMQDYAKDDKNIENILDIGQKHLESQHIQPEYLHICSETSLKPLLSLTHDEPARIFIAAHLGSARLIDNSPLFPNFNLKDSTPCD